jgi:hypothetical protein
MADWKDFYEDNREFRGQFLDSLVERRGSKATTDAPPAVPLRFCPLCHSAFIEDLDLASHIQSVHGPQHIYLRVNGRIIRDLAWAEQGISELRLVLLGFQDATVEISGPQIDKSLSVSGDQNLKRLIPDRFEGQLSLRVSPTGAAARQFTLYSRSLPEFRRDSLDDLIQELSAKDLTEHGAPDIIRWRERIGELGILEGRYLNGFFEYLLAFYLESQRQPLKSKQHFEDAFGLLLPFRTYLAHSAQCVLGIRMNSFGVLSRAPRKSIVAASDHFFNQPFGAEWVSVAQPESASPFMTYADDFTIRLVQVVSDFYASDTSICRAGLNALEFHPAAREKNNEDKLALLKARFHRKAGRSHEAYASYELLRYHPQFGSESESYIHGKSRA